MVAVGKHLIVSPGRVKCNHHFYEFTSLNVWPINSPDLSLKDYKIRGAQVEKDTNRIGCNNKVNLMDRNKNTFEAEDRDTVKVAYARFRGRIKAILLWRL